MSSRSSRSYGWSQGFWLVDSTHVTHTHTHVDGELATPATAAGPELAAAASRHAVARLWDLLQDFCSVGAAPASWRGEVPPDHPFLRWQPGAQRWLLIRVA